MPARTFIYSYPTTFADMKTTSYSVARNVDRTMVTDLKTTSSSAANTVNSTLKSSEISSIMDKESLKATHSKSEKRAAGIWDRFADRYFQQPIKDEADYQKKLAITRGYLTPRSRILEIGCGTGGTAIQHAPYVEHVHAIDFSSKMIDIAKKQVESANPKVSNIEFECVGLDSFRALEESYDAVLGLSILHLLPNKDETLRRVHGMIKPGGYFISSTTCLGDFARYLKYIAAPFSYVGLLPKLNVFTKDELKASIVKAGFVIEEEFHPGTKKDGKAVFLVAKKI